MMLLVTRPAAQAAEWVDGLRALGVQAVELPLLAIGAPADPGPVVRAWQGLADMALVVFVSPNAVLRFHALRPSGCPWPVDTLAASTGPGTSRELLRAGLRPTQLVEPDAAHGQFDSEALWARLESHDWRGRRVLIVRGDGGRDWLSDHLRSRGAEVVQVSAYRRSTPQWTAPQRDAFATALRSPGQHVWLFSSSEAIDQLSTLAPGTDWRHGRAIATHPRIAVRAQLLGFEWLEQALPSIECVAACLQSTAQ